MNKIESKIIKLNPGDIGHSFWDDIIDQVKASGKHTFAEFLNVIETPGMEALEKQCGMSTGEIMAHANSRG